MPRESLAAPQARAVALAASGFGRARADAPPSRRVLLGALGRLGMVQIDSVNVLTRAHYVPLYSRLGSYDRAVLDAASSTPPRAVFEYWGHEASLLPVATQPLLRWRMDRVHDDAWGGMVRVKREDPGLVANVAQVVAQLGPITASQVESQLAHDRDQPRTSWGWNWSAVKRALEYLFWAGEISSSGRDETFRRRYAATSQVIPAKVLAVPTPEPADAHRELIAIAARSLGVATRADLADYFRLTMEQARPAIADLVENGDLLPVRIPGWPNAYVHASARIPRKLHGQALLVGFDPLLWYRPRVERLFGMRYRIEIYVPAAQRQHGYYVLPFLFGDELVARVDLKADRRQQRLVVRGAHSEAGMPPPAVPQLASELRQLARWLGLQDVHVEPGRESLAQALAGELAGP